MKNDENDDMLVFLSAEENTIIIYADQLLKNRVGITLPSVTF